MENTVEKLIKDTHSEDGNVALKSIEYLGLLVERHLQDRYAEEDFFYLLDKRKELFDLKLRDSDIDFIIHTIFYQLINSNLHSVTLAWCLSKFYGKNILIGFTRLFTIYKNEDDVFIQLLMSINSIYDFRDISNIICNEFKKVDFTELPNSLEFLVELSEVFPFLKECLSEN